MQDGTRQVKESFGDYYMTDTQWLDYPRAHLPSTRLQRDKNQILFARKHNSSMFREFIRGDHDLNDPDSMMVPGTPQSRSTITGENVTPGRLIIMQNTERVVWELASFVVMRLNRQPRLMDVLGQIRELIEEIQALPVTDPVETSPEDRKSFKHVFLENKNRKRAGGFLHSRCPAIIRHIFEEWDRLRELESQIFARLTELLTGHLDLINDENNPVIIKKKKIQGPGALVEDRTAPMPNSGGDRTEWDGPRTSPRSASVAINTPSPQPEKTPSLATLS